MLRPATLVDRVTPTIVATRSRPAWVGVAPVAVCRKTGTKTVTENSTAVVRNRAALEIATARERRSSNGTIGAAARRSRRTSAPESSANAAISPTIVGEVQSYRLPPQMQVNISAL